MKEEADNGINAKGECGPLFFACEQGLEAFLPFQPPLFSPGLPEKCSIALLTVSLPSFKV
jgi:hypothetical protein